MKCLIIDDNPIARSIIAELAGQIRDVEICGECASAIEAFNFIQDNEIDLFFLDIEMPGISGLELTRNLGNNCPVIIFTTSKKDYAAEAFELNVADYLLKPICPGRFLNAINRAKDILTSQKEEVKWNKEEFIFIRDTNIVRRLRLDDILYAEAMGDYVKLYTAKKLYAIHTKFKTVEERLPSERFQKVHRSYIVALDKIDSLQDNTVLIEEKFLPVAESYRKALSQRMNVL